MRIRMNSRNLRLSPVIRDEATTKLSRVSRMFDRLLDMEVVFSEETNPRIPDGVRCEVVVHAKRRTIKACGTGPDPSTAIDRAEARLSSQVRKLKTQRIDRRRMASRHV